MPGVLSLDYQMTQWASSHRRPLVMIEIACSNREHKRRTPVTLPALIDTGADTCCIPRKFADACGHIFKRGRPVTVGGTTGEDEGRLHASVLRFTHPNVRLGGIVGESSFLPWKWEVDICVSSGMREFALLGLQDFLSHWDFRISQSKGRFQLVPVSPSATESVRAWKR